jgi:hypothetical protein
VSNKLDQQGKKINLSSSFSSQFSRLNSSSGKDNKNPVNTQYNIYNGKTKRRKQKWRRNP